MNERPPNFYRKPDGGYIRPVYDEGQIRKFLPFAGELSSEHPGGLTYGLALVILLHCFGSDWLTRHILDEPRNGFFCTRIGSDEGASIIMHKVCELAELVANLSAVTGVEAPFEQIVNGKIESGYAELEVGKLLAFAGVPFRFIWPSEKKGESFDIELRFPNGVTVCADAKCKLEDTAFSKKSVRNTLDKARGQLPKGHPSAILIKVPTTWVSDRETVSQIGQVCSDFFRSTSRIIFVAVFCSNLRFSGALTEAWHSGEEFRNSGHGFDAGDWRLFSRNGQLLSRPDSWFSLIAVTARPKLDAPADTPI